jgi:hypothetical protein
VRRGPQHAPSAKNANDAGELRADDDQDLPGFFTTYEVVANSADEALELARGFEPLGVRKTVQVEKSEIVEARPNGPKGVYSASGYSFFPGHEVDQDGAS